MSIEEIENRLKKLNEEVDRYLKHKTECLQELELYQRCIDETKVLIQYYEGLKDSAISDQMYPWEE